MGQRRDKRDSADVLAIKLSRRYVAINYYWEELRWCK